jgi:hypothetical protein
VKASTIEPQDGPESPSGPDVSRAQIDQFILECQDGLRHQVGGHSQPFLDLWSHADDVAILGAVGSYARGWPAVRLHLLGAAKRLDWTELSFDHIVTSVTDQLAFTVALEQMSRTTGEEPRVRTLRATPDLPN